MSHVSELRTDAPWVHLSTTEEDWAEAPASLLLQMWGYGIWIRRFEETVLKLAGDGLIHGPAHASIGQEGAAVGAISSLRQDDLINGSHRGHHQFLAKAFGHVLGTEGAGLPDLDEGVRLVLHRALSEICGLADGYCGGRGGSMHLHWREAGAWGTNAIVGGGVPQAAGFAWGQRHSGTDAVTFTFFGDGAMSIGSVLETLNLASAWKLPLCFFVENNQYAVSTPVAESTGEPRLSARGSGFAVPSWHVDGMDPLAVHLATQQALEHLRSGAGPCLIEADVYRYYHQNGPFTGSQFGYRSKEEEEAWRSRDPLDLLQRRILARNLVEPVDLLRFRSEIDGTLDRICSDLFEPDPDHSERRRVIPTLWPDPAFVDAGIRGDATEVDGVSQCELDDFDGELKQGRFIDAVSGVIAARMRHEPGVVVLGEDVNRLRGGTNGATRLALEEFPERVLGTPICENSFLGLSAGMAQHGTFRPIVEFMYADFLWVAADQLFNQLAKVRHMFGGHLNVPLVLRSKIGAGTGYGSQHSMDPAGVLATAPGLRIVAPSTPYDYVGLMNTALTLEDPVVVLEHVDLYTTEGPMPSSDWSVHLPVGRAARRRQGSDLTILTYLNMVDVSAQALDSRPEVSADLIDLRWLDRASLDWECIEESVRRTNRVLIVEQGAQGTSYGAWLGDAIARRLFDWLDVPVGRVCGSESSPSISKVLEHAALAGVDDVVRGIDELVSQ